MSASPPTWNLNDLYNSDNDPVIEAIWPEIDSDIKALKASFDAWTTGSIAPLIAQYEQISQRLTRVGSYAQLRHAAATDDPETSRFVDGDGHRCAARTDGFRDLRGQQLLALAGP